MNQIKWTITNVILAIVIIAGMIAAMYVALHEFGIVIPPFIITLFWIAVVCVAACFVIKFVASLFGGGGPPSGP
jgi:hypothetical protein